jgi:hypothetical protein
MKNFLGLVVLFVVFVMAPLSWAAELKVSHTDPEWKDGRPVIFVTAPSHIIIQIE